MKFEYLMVWMNNEGWYVAFDGNSVCDSDSNLIPLLNKLGQDRWEHCGYIEEDAMLPYHLLKRSLP